MTDAKTAATATPEVSVNPRFSAYTPKTAPSGFVTRNWRAIWGGIAALAHAFALWELYDRAAVFGGGNLRTSFFIYGVTYLFSCTVLGLFRSPYTSSFISQIRIAAKGHVVACLTVAAAWSIAERAHLVAELLVIIAAQAAAATAAHLALFVARDLLKHYGFALTPATVLMPSEESTADCVAELRSAGYCVTNALVYTPYMTRVVNEIEERIAESWTPVIILRSIRDPELVEEIDEFCQDAGIRLVMLSPRIREILRRAHVDDATGITVQSPVRYKIRRVQVITKRATDLALGIVFLVLTFPLLLLTALAIKLDSPGPILYRQPRSLTGHGDTFGMLKFRSMTNDAHRLRDDLRQQNQTSGALFKIRNDPRVTRVGRIIRKLSIDELPQIWNVIRGEMSLVGPRPLPMDDYAQLSSFQKSSAAYRRRALVPAGISGLWQIAGRSDLGFDEMVLLDAYYVEHASLFLDIHIIVHTIPVALFGRGAY